MDDNDAEYTDYVGRIGCGCGLVGWEAGLDDGIDQLVLKWLGVKLLIIWHWLSLRFCQGMSCLPEKGRKREGTIIYFQYDLHSPLNSSLTDPNMLAGPVTAYKPPTWTYKSAEPSKC